MVKQPWFWALCVAVGVGALVILVNVLGGTQGGKHTVVYSVTGTVSKPTIYYYDSVQKAQTVNDATLPWTKTVRVTGDAHNYRVGALVKSGSGKLSCSVKIDGKVVATRTSAAAKDPQVRCTPKQ
jgi:hypothetical protein